MGIFVYWWMMIATSVAPFESTVGLKKGMTRNQVEMLIGVEQCGAPYAINAGTAVFRYCAKCDKSRIIRIRYKWDGTQSRLDEWDVISKGPNK